MFFLNNRHKTCVTIFLEHDGRTCAFVVECPKTKQAVSLPDQFKDHLLVYAYLPT